MSTQSPSSSSRGFALVIAISLMAFVLVLVMTLTSLIRVETSLAKNQLDQLEAKQNARLGAFIALGELQKTMGPDTRVSAPAEILSTTNPDEPASGISPFNADEQTRFWTGVWDSGNFDPGPGPDPDTTDQVRGRGDRFLRWLVSLPERDPALPSFEEAVETVSESALPFSLNDNLEFVTLATVRAEPFSGGTAQPTQVRAGLRDIQEQAGSGDPDYVAGRYSWWVSDEGIKANMSLEDPYNGQSQSNVVADIPRFMFPHRGNLAATEWFESTDFSDSDLVDRLRRAAQLPGAVDLAFSDPSVALSTEARTALTGDGIFADYSFFNYGVLSSTRSGGLRKDLSLAFWSEPADLTNRDQSVPYASQAFEDDFRFRRIFNYQDFQDKSVRSTDRKADELRFFAPRWEVLRDYHNGFMRLADPATEAARLVPMPTSGSDNNYHTVSYNSGSGGMWGGFAHFDVHDRYAPLDPSREMTHNRDGTGQVVDPVSNGFTPIMLRWSMRYELVFIEKVDSSGNLVADGSGNQVYHPQMRMIPTIVLWNPHNVGFSFQDQVSGDFENKLNLRWSAQSQDRFDMTFEFENLSNGNTRTYRTTSQFDDYELFSSNDVFIVSFNETDLERNEFGPGEIKVYTVNGVLAGDALGGLFNDVATSSTFPPSDSYISFTTNFRNDENMEFIQGDAFTVSNSISIGEGPRPNFSFNNGGSIQDFRISGENSGPDLVSGTVNPNDPIYLGTLDLHMLPGPTEADHPFNPRRFANWNIRATRPKGGYMNSYTGQLPSAWIGWITDDIDVQKTTSGGEMLGYWGPSVEADGENYISLFDVPRRPPESLGQYQHAQLAPAHPNHSTYPFGNSFPDPHVRSQFAADYTNDRTLIDLSWLLNDALWEDYFLSTIDPYDIDGLNPTRLAPLRSRFLELDPTAVYDETGANADELDYSEVAENLLLKGAFNVNSTSVEAWAGFLAGLSGDGIRYLNPETVTLNSTSSLNYPFYRHALPLGSEDTPWTGGPRDMTRNEIRRLAENIVTEVKRRGPFLSISDFVNRRLTTDNRGLSGAIQAAIDATNSTSTIQDVVNDTETIVLPAPVPQHAEMGGARDLAPGYLSQADILTTIGPFLSARSDTFIIRSYGQSLQLSSGDIQGEAWCEMLVQRFPEEMDISSMGRPFRILGFRYLSADEI